VILVNFRWFWAIFDRNWVKIRLKWAIFERNWVKMSYFWEKFFKGVVQDLIWKWAIFEWKWSLLAWIWSFSQFSRICYASFSNFVKTIFSGLYMNLDDLQPIIVDFEPNEGYNMIWTYFWMNLPWFLFSPHFWI